MAQEGLEGSKGTPAICFSVVHLWGRVRQYVCWMEGVAFGVGLVVFGNAGTIGIYGTKSPPRTSEVWGGGTGGTGGGGMGGRYGGGVRGGGGYWGGNFVPTTL